ncbi:unnamed protein product [Phytophthora lilii]|uniref:Unnamed protein product n=1 Tax=Phytophthora lilii TaxID=2077276 RepID=A0A9W6TA82_9STRA|nr:unnamed protein product [Phytophthora lilii]
MDQSPSYTIAIPLRDQIATNFRHELFQFHQLLRDAIEASHQEHLQHADTQRSARLSRDRRILELLTSDRGDAVLKEFFVQWQHSLKKRAPEDSCNDEDNGSMLWDVLETFFANLPLVVSEADASGAGSPKEFFRYIDSLNSLRDLLLSLLFKRPAPTRSDSADADSDDESACRLQSSIGLGFGLKFNSRRSEVHPSPRFPRVSTDRTKDRTPFYLYCQKLENELEALRRRVPHRRPRSPGVVAGILGDVGLLQDNTVMLLLDFWGLPHEERLAFFCQIASQANEQDASAILHVFLDNCTTQTFLQVWEALQQSPQFQKVLREAKLQFEPATSDEADTRPSTTSAENESENATADTDTEIDKPIVWRGSQRGFRKRGRRSTRFVDLNGITEAFDFNENGGGNSSDEDEDGLKSGHGDTYRDSPRFQKIAIRERGRLSLSDASDHPDEESQTNRRGSFHRSRRGLKTPSDGESLPLLDRLHNNLTELIKMEDSPDGRVMDAVWQLLEALDGHRSHDSKSGYHRRHVPLPTPAASPANPVQPQHVVLQNPRASLRTPLSAEQQFLMKLDQLQSMLVALGEVRVHTMSTETITGAYRRIPILAKLFAAITDTSLGAAGVDTAGGGMSKIVSSYGKAQHLANSWQGGLAKDKTLDPLSIVSETSGVTSGDDVREDVEAMGLLLVKFSKFVRILAPLVDNEDSAPSSKSASDDVLVVMGLADRLESAGALAEVPAVSVNHGGGKRRLSLAADRELPIILAVQSLARSNDFDNVAQLISAAIDAKMTRIRIAALEGKPNGEGEDAEAEAVEGDEEVMRIVKNLRRVSAKAAQSQEARDQMQLQIQGGGAPITTTEGETAAAALRLGKGDIPPNIKNAAALRGVKLFSVDILLRIVNQVGGLFALFFFWA